MNTKTNITNREALKNKIHDIHNYMRNNGIGYGMNALKVFNVLYGLKKIEERNLIDKVGLKRPECEFSYLLKLANDGQDEKLTSIIFNEVVVSLYNSILNDLLFYDIPLDLKATTFSYIVKEIDGITEIENSCNVLLSGKIYEYFIGRDESAISELGAYFTDRHIVDYIYNKLDIQIYDDNTIDSMIDMFGGSGGFTTGYINFLNNKYPEINWKKELKKVHHYDMNKDVLKSAGLEFFCLTGVLPNTKNNLRYKNSFTDEFDNKKFKYVITNPPYGGDKSKKTDEQIKREKTRTYIESLFDSTTDKVMKGYITAQLKKIKSLENDEKKRSDEKRVSTKTCSNRIRQFAKKYGLTGNDKESVSLMLIMDMLDNDGTAVGVLKEGVIFDKKYTNLRKCLIENFNVKEIISIPRDQFENTMTKTSIVIFENTEIKTTKVKFSELVIEKFDTDKYELINNEFILIENKGDINNVSDNILSTATRDSILKTPTCSFNGKDYRKKKVIVNNDMDYIRIGDLCESRSGYAFKTIEYKESGIPLITITHIKNGNVVFNNGNYIEENDKYKDYEIKQDDVIITMTGKKPTLCSLAINKCDTKQYLNQRCALLRNFSIINAEYFAAIFDAYINDYINENIGNGTNQENIALSDILDIKVPIPKSSSIIMELTKKLSHIHNIKLDTVMTLNKVESDIVTRLHEIKKNNAIELGNLCEFLPKSKRHASFGKNIGKYDFYASCATVRKCDIADYDSDCVVIGTGGNSCIHYANKRFSASGDTIILKTEKINNRLLYYILVTHRDAILDEMNGSILKHIKKEMLEHFAIKIPTDKKALGVLETLLTEVSTLQNTYMEINTKYIEYVSELKSMCS